MIRWSFRKLPTGDYAGMISMVPCNALPTGHPAGKPIKLVARSRTKAGALAKAASVAQMMANNPLLSAAMPPGTSQAIKAVSFLSKSAAAGKLESAAKKVVGKGAKRLSNALKSLF